MRLDQPPGTPGTPGELDDQTQSIVEPRPRTHTPPEVPTGFSRAHRLIVILRRYEGMTFREIGTILDLDPDVVERMYQMACDPRD